MAHIGACWDHRFSWAVLKTSCDFVLISNHMVFRQNLSPLFRERIFFLSRRWILQKPLSRAFAADLAIWWRNRNLSLKAQHSWDMIHLPDPKVAVCEGRAWFRYLSFRAAFAALSRISGDIWCGGNNVLVCKFWRCIYTTSHVILFYDLFSSTLLSRAFAREHYYKLFRKSFAASIYSAFAEPSDINVLTILNTWVSSLLSCSIKFFHSKIALGRALRESWGVACATTEKHWCPVSTFACFPREGFPKQTCKNHLRRKQGCKLMEQI